MINGHGNDIQDLKQRFKTDLSTHVFDNPQTGGLLVNPKLIAKLRNHRMCGAVNALALKAGEDILNLPSLKTIAVRERVPESKLLQQELASVQGILITTSPTKSIDNKFIHALKSGLNAI